MQRRLLITALAAWPVAGPRAQDSAGRPRHKISAATLHEALSARFPVRVGVGGFLELQVSAPSLHLLPARNQLGAGLLAEVAGIAPQMPPGEMDVVFALRYEPADRSVRAHRPEVLALRWPGMPPDMSRTLQRVLPAMAQEAIGEFVLHQFTQRELALPDTMGFEPQELTVVADGLSVVFGPKSRR